MSVVTFLGTGKEQSGKTLAVAAIATNMAIERNKRILVISVSNDTETLKNCYWKEELTTKKSTMFGLEGKVELDSGIEGLAKIIQSNRVSPNLITDYTSVVFKERLEILIGFDEKTLYSPENVSKIYKEIVNLATQYYDMVIVDLDNEIGRIGVDEILNRSDVIVAMTSQRLASIKKMKSKIGNSLPTSKTILLIGRHDRKSKYTIKNLTRMLGEKKEILTIPYNTLFFEAAQEGNVADLFLKLRRIEDKNDTNSFFMEQVKKVNQEIIKKIEESELRR